MNEKRTPIIVNEELYFDGGRKTGNTQWNGFGGAEWNILMDDGTKISTNNLWHCGNVPHSHAEIFKDNAVFEK